MESYVMNVIIIRYQFYTLKTIESYVINVKIVRYERYERQKRHNPTVKT